MKCECAVLYYCHMWPVLFYHIFPHYLINDTTSEKKLVEHEMCIFSFSIYFFFEKLLILRRIQRIVTINDYSSSLTYNARYYLSSFNET